MARLTTLPAHAPVPEQLEKLETKQMSFEQIRRELGRMYIQMKGERRKYFTLCVEVLRDNKRTADDQHVATFKGWANAALNCVKILARAASAIPLVSPEISYNLLHKITDLSKYDGVFGGVNYILFAKDMNKILTSLSQVVDTGKDWHDNSVAGDRTEISNQVDRLKSFVDLKVQEMLAETREENEAIQKHEQQLREEAQAFSRMCQR